MSKGQSNGGLMSSVGLVRYLDVEDRNAIRVNPKTIFAVRALFGTGVLILNSFMF